MVETDRRCGTCRWWGERRHLVEEYYGDPPGDCEWIRSKLPKPLHVHAVTFRQEQTDCSTWEAKPTPAGAVDA